MVVVGEIGRELEVGSFHFYFKSDVVVVAGVEVEEDNFRTHVFHVDYLNHALLVYFYRFFHRIV